MSTIGYNGANTERARALRKEATKEERKLWYQFLSKLPIAFRRQKPIGEYIVDFYCTSAKLVIELDGSQHYEDDGIAYDERRSKYLQSLGLTVIRYSNYQIQREFEAVCRDIANRCGVEY